MLHCSNENLVKKTLCPWKLHPQNSTFQVKDDIIFGKIEQKTHTIWQVCMLHKVYNPENGWKFVFFFLNVKTSRRWLKFFKLPFLQTFHYTANFALQPVFWTCQSCEVYWKENNFFICNLTKVQFMSWYFFLFYMKF